MHRIVSRRNSAGVRPIGIPSRLGLGARALLLWLAALACAESSARAATYYVDHASATCANSGASTGTEAKPYCTISSAVNARGGPGVTIRVKPGVYREQVTINTSGATGSPLVLQAVTGGVVVDAADDYSDLSKWSQVEDDVWLAAGVTWNPKQVFADGARLQSDSSDPEELPAGTYRWISGEGLYVNAGTGNPSGHQVQVGRRSYGFSLFARSWITIEGFAIRHTEDRGINVAGSCANIRLARNTITFAYRMGIQVSGGSGMVICANVISDSQDHGISLTNGVTGSALEDNVSSGNAHPTQRIANGIYLFGSPRNVMRRNRLHHNQDSGIHIQSGSNDCFLLMNHSWANGDHGFDHLGASGAIHVLDVAYGNYRDGFSIEGGSPGTQIYHSIAADNGITANHSDLWVEGNSTAGFTSNFNLFWNSTSQQPIRYIATRYATVAAYSAVSGQDGQSLQANPRFVNAAAGDFRLRKDSPALQADGAGGEPIWPTAGEDGSVHPRRFHPGHEPPPGVPLRGAPAADPAASVIESVPPVPPTVAPNPFARSATLRFTTSRPGPLAVAIFDVAGRRVRAFAEDAAAPAGLHVFSLDGRGDDGAPLAAGVYHYRIRSADGLSHGRFVLTK